MGTEYSNALPTGYDRDMLDDKGNTLKVSVINQKLLALHTVVVEGNVVHMTSSIDQVCVPIDNTMRLIMHIANIVQFSGALGEDKNEILRAIEVIARHAA